MNSGVEIRESAIHGKGVFAKRAIEAGEVVAVSHVTLLHHNEELPEMIATLEFPWDEEYYTLCLSDVGSFFNHHKDFNTKVLEQDKMKLTQTFVATRNIIFGEELFIFYNDDFEQFVSN
jgi:SET domain-containing protein